MTSGYLGLSMLGLIVMAIMMGFPTAFTLMGLGMLFGFVAYFDPSQSAIANRVFDLMVQRTYGGMTNDTLLSIPLFVLMGYVIERAALVDRMFHAVQLSFRRLPASLAVATLIVCTFWGIASGIVGAVVVLMGVIAMRPMLKAGYDVRLAAGVITAGGTLGILIPPSVMLIVYAAVAGQSVVKLYAAAMVPGFLLAFLYLVYVIAWAKFDPKVAPSLPPELLKIDVPRAKQQLAHHFGSNALVAAFKAVLSPGAVRRAGASEITANASAAALQADPSLTQALTYRSAWTAFGVALTPFLLSALLLGGVWWYVVIHSAPAAAEAPASMSQGLADPPGSAAPATATGGVQEPPAVKDELKEPPGALPSAGVPEPAGAKDEPLQALGGGSTGTGATPYSSGAGNVPAAFFPVFWSILAISSIGLVLYYRKFRVENMQVASLLIESVMPLAVLTILVLVVILFGITTATESAAVGALGAFLLAWQSGQLTFAKTKEAVYLTAKTTSMVCWLFVGSALFSAVFALHGGQEMIEKWILGMNLSPLQFLMLSQALIFILGWPLEWTEIIVIFVPIFLPLLAHFQVDPLIFATLVAVNLQAAFLSPPVAMSAFYLKGVSPPHVTLNQIFAGMMPYMFIVIICMVLLYVFPQMILWFPEFLYGK
jgi:TRAP-type mannitol/chloroaromatic compound transport system permease large subunit